MSSSPLTNQQLGTSGATVSSLVSHSFRENYAGGVDKFYTSHGSEYRNPHAPVLKRVFRSLLARWSTQISFHRTLDLACGSGEVTESMKEWFNAQGIPVVAGCST